MEEDLGFGSKEGCQAAIGISCEDCKYRDVCVGTRIGCLLDSADSQDSATDTSAIELAHRIREFWEDAEIVGPTLDTPLICCLCTKEKEGSCKVQDFREFCDRYTSAQEDMKQEYVILAPIISSVEFQKEEAMLVT